jgi:hypothetical protein
MCPTALCIIYVHALVSPEIYILILIQTEAVKAHTGAVEAHTKDVDFHTMEVHNGTLGGSHWSCGFHSMEVHNGTLGGSQWSCDGLRCSNEG